MTAIDRKPAFWIAYALLALASLAVAWQLFPLAIPLVNLDIKMTRADAIAKAETLAAERKLAPEGARSAAVFNHDDVTQSYVELEGGGKPAFARLVAGNLYAPYWWDVRLFKAGVIDEVLLRFKPDGALDGFTRRLPETYVRDPATKALTAEAALHIARTRAAQDWDVALRPYHLLEQSQQVRVSGRVDHLFVFERDEELSDARIRLQLVVSGDELTKVLPFVHVPEGFERRFQEMRSANDAIAGIATITAGMLYGLVGCILGALWLLRQHWLVWKPPLVAGMVIGLLLAATILANSPSAWFGFSTAQEEGTFWVRQGAVALLVFLGGGLALGEVFMAAEGLTRRAFPQHPQLWRLWSREAAGTVEIAGRTAGGYLFVPMQLALIAVFYFVTNRWLGWWQPSEALTDPNILSSVVPALTPISIALQAGFMEECVFRAVPLALGALIGERYGRRKLGIAIAFVLQAVVFGGAHANYPGFPSYSRLVELTVPSMLWALIFLRYGLLPTIMFHALFDLALISIPLFLVDAEGAWVQRALVIAAALVPAAVVLTRRMQNGTWGTLPQALRNGAWRPLVPAIAAPERVAVAGTVSARAALLQRALPLLGLAGLAAWIEFTALSADVPRSPSTAAPPKPPPSRRSPSAVSFLVRSGIASRRRGPRSRIRGNGSIMRSSGAKPAPRLIARSSNARWRLRCGTCASPASMAMSRIARKSGASRCRRWPCAPSAAPLPEARPGAQLERDAAQAIAERALRDLLGQDAGALQLRSADQTQRPARRDWAFTYADPHIDVGKGGEARMQVVVAGDEVVLAAHSVFVPEAWQRSEVEREGRRQLAKISSIVVIGLAAIAALIYAVIAWSKGRSDHRAFRWVTGISLLMLAGSANNWPVVAMQLKTAEPVTNQLVILILGALAGGLLFALLFGLLAGVGAYYARTQMPGRVAGRTPPWLLGVGAALATAGISAALTALVTPVMPVWPD